jgi:WD40 repeat protein
VRQLAANTYVESVAFSLDGRRALVAGGHAGRWPGGAASPRNHGQGYGVLQLWDLDSSKEVRRFVLGSIILSAAFSPDSHYALTGSCDHVVRRWRLPK